MFLVIKPVSNERRIVLLGKTGTGKSSLANTIFGEQVFKFSNTANSETKQCQAETRCVNGRSITLIDTPGFFDTDRPEEEMKPEILRCFMESASRPHAFLIMLKVEKYTKHEQEVIDKIKENFSKEVFKYATVVFTHGDQLPEGQKIKDHFQDNKILSALIKKCGGRCHVVDNKYWKENPQDEYRSNRFQVKEILNAIEKTVMGNNGSCFTYEVLQEDSQQEEDHVRQSSGNMPQEEVREQAGGSASKKFGSKLAVSSKRRIVLLGKTGDGKSSLANTIFGEQVFKVSCTAKTETKRCQAETRCVNGRSITLIDTPGFFDTDRPEEEMKSEILRCIIECAPGPHAFLIVLKVERFTKHEQEVIVKIKENFSEEVFKYTTVVFTHGDQLPEGQKIEDYVHHYKLLSDLMKKCGGRCHVVDNKYWKQNPKDEYRSNRFQVKEILNTIEKIVMENNGSYYTNEMLLAVEEEIQQEEKHFEMLLENQSRGKKKNCVLL